eukprot:TRINITY_DN54029_c0_g1_i1.p1 TRINITY_DN54029_c0_g1~~TRINITY_DN54029_c0_g1_i1.p1  ORF type:complete len:466 (+),score=107.14 TRINITY_DN54029_c0_g1_i1:128-1525(+)
MEQKRERRVSFAADTAEKDAANEDAEPHEKRGLLRGGVSGTSSSSTSFAARRAARRPTPAPTAMQVSRALRRMPWAAALLLTAAALVTVLAALRIRRAALARTTTRRACVGYGLEHELVRKQAEGKPLTRNEVEMLLRTLPEHEGSSCEPSEGTRKLVPDVGDGLHVCLELYEPYTACFRRGEGELSCGIFFAGAKALHHDDVQECLGGCQGDGEESCLKNEWRGECLAHDLCFVVSGRSAGSCGKPVFKQGECPEKTRKRLHSVRIAEKALVPEPPCVDYSLDHELVQKQVQGKVLTNEDVHALVQAPQGEEADRCTAVSGTQKIYDSSKYVCLEMNKPYTVCYDTRRSPGNSRRRRGTFFCGVFLGGAQALRDNGHVDCLGGCNEGKKACGVHEWRGACFEHDVCSSMTDATGFMSDKNCGDEALEAVEGWGTCGPQGWSKHRAWEELVDDVIGEGEHGNHSS